MTDDPLQHAWNVTPQEAIAIQQRLRTTVVTHDALGDVQFVAGVDVGFEAGGSITRAAVAVLHFPELVLHEQAIARRPTSFPYIPGLLSFREVPAILQALDGLRTQPHLLLCDGQGYIHPRRFGLACHLGVLTDLPAIGVGKTPFIGHHVPVDNERGDWQPIIDHDEVIGAVLRSKPDVQPIYVSIGHRISLNTAIDYVLRCTTKYRLPETTRWAHNLASRKDRT
ncbi:MAG: deoxyribonuclease V [Herpetosiphonaceae bacterium]|nr:deoxyribonuclease V [Herpetosiphonaceae bacterium]